MKKWTVTALCVVSLAGCVSQNKAPGLTPTAAAPSDPQSAWQQRQAQFARMASWRLQGRAGIQFRDQSASFGLSWVQQGKDQYEMNINNPITGSLVALLKGTGSQVTLQTNGQTYTAADAESLLQSRVGVTLPVAGMKYWVRRLPSPDYPVEDVQLDNLGRPQVLQQTGWRVTYTGWQGENSEALPVRINLERAAENTRVRVVAKEWQTRY